MSVEQSHSGKKTVVNYSILHSLAPLALSRATTSPFPIPLSDGQRRPPKLHHIDREGEMVLPPPLLIYTQGHGHLPSILPYPCGGCPPLGPTAPPQWRDAHYQRPREGPCTHPTPHRQTRLDSHPPPHTHTDYSTGGYRSYRRWVSRS